MPPYIRTSMWWAREELSLYGRGAFGEDLEVLGLCPRKAGAFKSSFGEAQEKKKAGAVGAWKGRDLNGRHCCCGC